MRTIPANILTEIQSNEYRPFDLLDFVVDSTHYRYTSCDIPLVYDGNIYTPRGFEIDRIKYSSNKIVDSVTIKIDNLDSVLTFVFVGGDPKGESVILYQMVIESEWNLLIENGENLLTEGGELIVTEQMSTDTVILFEGILDNWKLDEVELSIKAVNILNQWTQRTLQRHSPSCRWKAFEGTECGYSNGAGWCDRTYTRCAALSNTANFGGFRWLPSIVDKVVWWGNTPENAQ